MLKYFCGRWKLFREIRSLADEHYIALAKEGVASFYPWEGAIAQDLKEDRKDQWLLYRESGTLENFDFPAASGHFTRQYLYKFPVSDNNDDDNIKVYLCSKTAVANKETDPLNREFDCKGFKDDGFFHDLVFPQGLKWNSLTSISLKEPFTAVGEHLCGKDRYKGVFQIYSLDNFKTVWKVTGPEKSFQINSIYTRLP